MSSFVTPVPLVSVIVPAYNGSATIGATLKSALRQDYPNLEVVVVSDGSRDATVEMSTRFADPRIRVVEHQANQGLAASLMEGLRHTQGPVVMFLHQDCELTSSTWISQAVSYFQDPKVGWVTGYYETLKPERTHLVHQAFAVLRGEMLLRYVDQKSGVHTIPFSEGKCDLLRRDIITSIGGIPLILRCSGEDQLLSYAVRTKGWTILKDSSLQVYQNYTEGRPHSLILGNLKKEFLHGKTQAVINLKHWRTILSDLTEASFAARKGLHPTFKLGAFVVTLGSLLFALLFSPGLNGFAPLFLFYGVLAGYYLWKCYYSGVRHLFLLMLLVMVLGFTSYMPYGIGLGWGMLRFFLMKARLYTKPI